MENVLPPPTSLVTVTRPCWRRRG